MRSSMTVALIVFNAAVVAARADATGGSWSRTGSLHTARASPMAVTLQNGKVLVAGGLDKNNQALSSAELFDPSTGTWSRTGSMQAVRSNGTLTLLTDGTVLAAGGFTFPQNPSGTSAEIYNPATGKWKQTGSLTTYRVYHTATLLSNGKVLVAGGVTQDESSAVASAELYDPRSKTWSATGSMTAPRAYHAATLLSNGRVLVSGGDHDLFFGAQGSAEEYDPGSGHWSPVGRMMTSRRFHTLTTLADGSVLATGGTYGGPSGGNPLSMSDRWNPATGVWSPVGDMRVVRHGVPTVAGREVFTATLLADGRVLVAGGTGNVDYNTFTVFKTAEIFDPATNTWALTGNMHVERAQHAAVLLGDGRVLVIGGFRLAPGDTATCEIFTPSSPFRRSAGSRVSLPRGASFRAAFHAPASLRPVTRSLLPRAFAAHSVRRGRTGSMGSWALTGSMHVARAGANGFPAVLLQNGKVLVEGCDQYLGRGGVTAELWDPTTGKWSKTGSMHVPRCNHGAALLPDGRVLVAGGDSQGTVHFTAEIYDPATGKWAMSAHLNSTRFLFSMLTLPNGAPFAPAGAAFETIPRDSADGYDPSTGSWTATPSLNISRYIYGAVVLLDGKVLVFGGTTQNSQWTSTSELYDPVTNQWTLQGSTIDQAAVGVTLGTGDVLATIPSQLYSESSGKWSATKSNMKIPRINDTLTLLTDGLALAAGGCTACGSGGGNVAQSELYDPTTQTWALDAPLNQPRSSHAAVRLNDGRVLVAGGLIGFTQISSAEVYTPAH
jgi:N-acetylneuraminic acid mutarotase